jgi:hypothetical protein
MKVDQILKVWFSLSSNKKALWIFIDFTRFLTLNNRYLWGQWIDIDEKYRF